jgi:hypothetical protein
VLTPHDPLHSRTHYRAPVPPFDHLNRSTRAIARSVA